MKLVVWKNHLGGQIWYRSLDPVKKQRLYPFVIFFKLFLDFFIFYWEVNF